MPECSLDTRTYTKVKMPEVGQDSYDLVLVSEGRDKWTYILATT